MKRQLLASLALMSSLAFPLALKAEPTKGYYTMDAMGCMILRECTKDVDEVYSTLDISSNYKNMESFTVIAQEFNNMLMTLNQVGVKVYLADEKYFPVGHRGVYHTVSNAFFLNKTYMGRPNVLMSVMRHEGWHAAQDCMAGTVVILGSQ